MKSDISAVNQSLFSSGTSFTGNQVSQSRAITNVSNPMRPNYTIMSAGAPKPASIALKNSSSSYVTSLNTKNVTSAFDSKVSHHMNQYVDATSMQSNLNKNLDTSKIVNNNFKAFSKMASTIEQANIAPQFEAAKKIEVVKAEEVSFKIENV